MYQKVILKPKETFYFFNTKKKFLEIFQLFVQKELKD